MANNKLLDYDFEAANRNNNVDDQGANDAFVPFLARQVDPSPMMSPSMTPSASMTFVPTPTASMTMTMTPSNTISPGASTTNTATATATPSNTPSISITASPTLSTGASPTNTATATATPSVSASSGTADGPVPPNVTSTPSITPSITPRITPSSTPSITPSITPAKSPFFKTLGPKVCSKPADVNYGLACKRLVSKKRLTKLEGGGVTVRISLQFGRFRWRVKTLSKELRIKAIAPYISTRKNPSSTIINKNWYQMKKRRFQITRTQQDLIELMPNVHRHHQGCCGSHGYAFFIVHLCKGKTGECYKKRTIKLKFKIKCHYICPSYSTGKGLPVHMGVFHKCPTCQL